jgi:enterochelin esterase-like enzyme
MKRFLLFALALALAAGAATQTGAQAPQGPDRSRVVEATYRSEMLGCENSYLIYLPAGYDAQPDRKWPVLYLLHGAGDDHTGWRDKGEMKLITDEHTESGLALPMIVVMPDASGEGGGTGGGSIKNRGYFNQPAWPYEDHFFAEFIPHIERTYRIVGDRRHRAVAGLSMGGGGSVGYAQKHPEMFSSACPLSGALAGMGGPSSPGYFNSVRYVAEATEAQEEALRGVRWWVDCGDDDFLWQANVDFFRAMREKRIPLQYRVRNGAHNWEYWQTALPDVLTFVSVGFSEQ